MVRAYEQGLVDGSRIVNTMLSCCALYSTACLLPRLQCRCPIPTFPCLPVPRSCVHNSRCTRHWPWRSRSSILDAYASASLHRSHPHAASVRCASTLSPKPEVYVCVSGQRDPSTKRASRNAATEFAGWPRLAYSGHVLTFFAASS